MGYLMKRGATFRKKKQNRLTMLAVTLVVTMLFFVIAAECYRLKQKQDILNTKEIELQAKIDAENERTQELVELKKYTQTKKYAEEVAKEKLGLVYEDEIIFKPKE